MDTDCLSPHIRHAKRQTSGFLSGGYVDFDHVLTYVESGSANFWVDGYLYPVHPGHVILLPPETRHVIQVPHGTNFEIIVIHFDPVHTPFREKLTGIGMSYYKYMRASLASTHPTPQQPEETQEALEAPRVLLVSPQDRIQVEQLLRSTLQVFHSDDPSRKLLLKGYCTILLALCLGHGLSPSQTPTARIHNWALLHRAMDTIHQRYSDPELDNRRIAEAASVTPNHLSSVFREQFGLTLGKYVTHVRMEEAKRQLSLSSLSITQIAENTGFTSIHSFTRSFHRTTSMSPSQYRDLSSRV